ncbi:MAG: hypothetical protein HY893_08035 [Deltaproteobacteria bacterium]|nr:hypothetical protein [Deltaproteobacteria bacterium]
MSVIGFIRNHWVPTPQQMNQSSARVIKNSDSDGDKLLTQSELGIRPENFSKVDKNNDQLADVKELNAYTPFRQIFKEVKGS